MASSSSLYSGRVTHTRLRPLRHRFSYRVFYALFDIDEIESLAGRLRWFSVGRFNLFGFDRSKHGPADGSDLRPWVEATLLEAGVDLDGGKIFLLAFPRLLGFVFNPISIWYCYGPGGELRAVLHEVRNTFGDRHIYVVPVDTMGLRHGFAKELHVSPFNPMDQHYEFTVSTPGRTLTVTIDQEDEDGRLLRAGMALERSEFTDRNLLRLFFGNPLLTFKVVTSIHWQALRLWLKGATFHHRPTPASHNITLVGRERVST